MRCKFCHNEIEEFIVHEGARDEPPTTRLECPACGPVALKKEEETYSNHV